MRPLDRLGESGPALACGLADGSESGRALAAAFTSLMTAVSYRRSSELAAVVGSYDGFACDAAGHARVMRKHVASNDAARRVADADRAPFTSGWGPVAAIHPDRREARVAQRAGRGASDDQDISPHSHTNDTTLPEGWAAGSNAAHSSVGLATF